MNAMLLNLGLIPIPPVPGGMPREPTRAEICRAAAQVNAKKRQLAKNSSKSRVLEAVTGQALTCTEAGKAAGLVKGYAYNLLLELVSEGLVTRSKGHQYHYYKAVV